MEYAKIKYDQAKLKVKGYSPPNVDDKSETGMISHFEKRLKFGMVDIDEFERRLKKLIDVKSNDTISIRQLEECFSDHYAFRDIRVEGSLLRDIMTSKYLKKNEKSDEIYIPYLVMFGILYCASNTELKVQKFYEGAQIDLDA